MLHLYIGNGKGKTTAATGLAVRAMGRGLKVLFGQFLKTTDTGEKLLLEKCPSQLTFFRPEQRHHAFLWNMTEEQVRQTREDIEAGWLNLSEEMFSGQWNLVVLDEILDVIQVGMLSESEVLDAILRVSQEIEVVCTGRNASGVFRENADYVTWMEPIKHPYEKGISARCGIEY